MGSTRGDDPRHPAIRRTNVVDKVVTELVEDAGMDRRTHDTTGRGVIVC